MQQSRLKQKQNKPFVNSRLHPWSATHYVYLLFFITEQNLVGIHAVVSAVRLLPLGIHVMHHIDQCVKKSQVHTARRGPSHDHSKHAQQTFGHGF